MNAENDGDGVFRWKAMKQSLVLVMAIFLSTTFAVAFSTGMQKVIFFVRQSVYW